MSPTIFLILKFYFRNSHTLKISYLHLNMYFYVCKNVNNMQESFEPAETDFFNRKWK